MADKKISELDAVTDVQDTDEYVLARSGASKKITGASLRSEVGGSSSFPPPEGQEFIGSGPVTIGGSFINVTFPLETEGGGPLFDFTTPTTPEVIETGLYAFYLGVFVPTHADAGLVQIVFNLDFAGADVSQRAVLPLSATVPSYVNVFPVYYLTAGMQIAIYAKQNSGTDMDLSVDGQSYVQRIA